GNSVGGVRGGGHRELPFPAGPQPGLSHFGTSFTQWLPSQKQVGPKFCHSISTAPIPAFSNISRNPPFPKIPHLQTLPAAPSVSELPRDVKLMKMPQIRPAARTKKPSALVLAGNGRQVRRAGVG